MRQQDIFKSVLEVENTPQLLDFSVPGYGFLLWPYIRYTFLAWCLEHFFPGKFILNEKKELETSLSRCTLLARTASSCFRPWPQRNIWIYSKVGSLFYKNKQDRLYNQYVEPLAEIFAKQTLVLNASAGPDFIRSPLAFSLRHVAPVELIAGKLTRFMPDQRYLPPIKGLLNFLQTKVKQICGFSVPDDVITGLEKQLIYLSKYTVAEHTIYKKIFALTKPKLFIIDGAYYGTFGHLTLLCKQSGITVADMQHGMIDAKHIAYNWAPKLSCESMLAEQLPDYFLTYGPFWHNSFNAPGTCQPIGNPWFAEQSKNHRSCKNNGILFALANFYDEFYDDIMALRRNFPEKEIILRPHPHQHDLFFDSAVSKIDGVTVDTGRNLYETLTRVQTVVGMWSTSLFEAAALGKKVFIKNSLWGDSADDHLFTLYSTSEELIHKIGTPSDTVADITKSIFMDNWEKRYKEWVTSVI